MNLGRSLLAALLCILANAAFAQLACNAPQKPMMDIEFILGHGKADDARWTEFLAREVTPRFPDGLTVYETTGQWRDPRRNVITREKSRVLRIITADDASLSGKIDAVALAYKRQFRQQSVGVVTRPACVSF